MNTDPRDDLFFPEALFLSGRGWPGLNWNGGRHQIGTPAAIRSECLAALCWNPQYTHWVAISNNRLVSIDGDRMCFRWKDYRDGSQQKVMSLRGDEFIRRFLIHVLPDGFRRIRYFGFLANSHRTRKLTLCRKLLRMAPTTPTEPPADYRDRYEALTGISLRQCPHCHIGIMVVVGCIERPRVCQPVPDT